MNIFKDLLLTTFFSFNLNTIISNCLFQDIYSYQKGGSIYFSSLESNFTLLNSGFINISSSVSGYSAGAVSVLTSKNVYFFLICFLKCFCNEYDPTSYLIASHGGTNLNSSLLFISENLCGYNTKSGFSSAAGSNYLIFKFNNISSFSSIYNLGGFTFLPILNSLKICEFSSIFNCSGFSFISSYGFTLINKKN